MPYVQANNNKVPLDRGDILMFIYIARMESDVYIDGTIVLQSLLTQTFCESNVQFHLSFCYNYVQTLKCESIYRKYI